MNPTTNEVTTARPRYRRLEQNTPGPSNGGARPMKNGSNGYTKLPNDVLMNTRLPPRAKLLYALLLHHQSAEHGCFPGRETLAVELGVSVPTTDRALSDLDRAGLITRKRRGFSQSSRYPFPLTNHSFLPLVIGMSGSIPATGDRNDTPSERSPSDLPATGPSIPITSGSSIPITSGSSPLITRPSEQDLEERSAPRRSRRQTEAKHPSTRRR